MSKPTKTRRTTDDDSSEIGDLSEEKKSGPTHFIAILKSAKTYNLAGRTFVRGNPVEVPIQFLKTFKKNGWFLVQQPR